MNDHETVPVDQEKPQGDVNLNEEESGEASSKLVPVAEARRYRKRAQAAEKLLEEAQAELAEKNLQLERNAQAIHEMERSRRVDELLLDAEAVDLEAARLLTELALSEMDDPDVETAVDELRRRKPYMFQRRPRSTGVLSPHAGHGESPHADSIQFAAAEAGATGRRTDLLRYLRLRRVGA